MDIFLDKFLFPLLVAIISNIYTTVKGKDENVHGLPSVKSFFSRTPIIVFFIAFLITLAVLFLLSLIPPYSIRNITWCQSTSAVRIEGQVTQRFGSAPVFDQTVQIQVFPALAGNKDAIEPGVYATSDSSGKFSTEIDKTAPTWSAKNGEYVINIGYWFKNMFDGELFGGFDKRFPPPLTCK